MTIMSLSGENQEEFFAHMSELAATLAVELEQDSVVYQIFHGGIVKFVGARRTVKR